MKIPFHKYHGTGNDFILIDQREMRYLTTRDIGEVARLCDRRFGIGGDGLILLEKSTTADFKMIYFNADGRQSTMCGNGGRCIVSFAKLLGLFEDRTTFEAIDGIHFASLLPNGWVSLGMNDVNNLLNTQAQCFVLDTGSPHYVEFMESIPDDVKASGSKIRYSSIFKDEGINVNFVVKELDQLQVATYERGVEDETYSCGTGVVASAIASLHNKKEGNYVIKINTKGGNLSVKVSKTHEGKFTDIYLEGPAEKVFDGLIEI